MRNSKESQGMVQDFSTYHNGYSIIAKTAKKMSLEGGVK